MAVLREAAPTALDGLPSWATTEEVDSSVEKSSESFPENSSEKNSEDNVDPEKNALKHQQEKEEGSAKGKEAACGVGAASGSLARELRQRVFELEGQVFDLEGRLALSTERQHVTGGGFGGDLKEPGSGFEASQGDVSCS